jgi:hypothetical protein
LGSLCVEHGVVSCAGIAHDDVRKPLNPLYPEVDPGSAILVFSALAMPLVLISSFKGGNIVLKQGGVALEVPRSADTAAVQG